MTLRVLPVMLLAIGCVCASGFVSPLPSSSAVSRQSLLHRGRRRLDSHGLNSIALTESFVEDDSQWSGRDLLIVDTHVHIWSDGTGKFPYAEGLAPPENLQKDSDADGLLKRMGLANVGGALIVQPACHLFDHSFVKEAIDARPEVFKGMCLANPSHQTTEESLSELRQRKEEGFVACRFNPALFKKFCGDEGMRAERCKELYRECGESSVSMPVGFMCMDGLAKHAESLDALMTLYPQTIALIDHLGFFRQDGRVDEDSFNALLTLLKRHPQLKVKASALFRVSGEDFPFSDVKERFVKLLDTAGAQRVMTGSDWPWAEQKGAERDLSRYGDSFGALMDWQRDLRLFDEEMEMILAGTATQTFGPFGGRWV
mmetsp:Transcript_4115/g.8394  ORF Transcript_4115/g.8394 Transcript_4115/m.8394 type:complete len:372 (-) Transcript_4115:65-1180(-)